MNKIIDSVIEFNQTCLEIEPRQLGPLSDDEAKFAARAIRSEIVEFDESVENGDFIGCVDAMLDTIYFAVGTMYRMGMTADQIERCFMVVHNKNMEKKLGKIDGRSTDLNVADAVKPAGWVGPEEEIGKILGE